MANKRYLKNKPVTISIQKFNIRKEFKTMIEKEYHGIGLKIILKIQPVESSKFYKVLLKYESLQKMPQVYVRIDQLEIEDKESIPHKYGIKNINGNEYAKLCLYYKDEWDPTMKITETIIPWVCEWLYHFEFWCITGKWCGGGKHPTKKDIKENDKN